MAFNTNAARSNNDATKNDSWKAQGFLNFYLPTENGGKRKLGAIALKASKESEAELVEWLNADPSRAQKILAKLMIDYQEAKRGEGTGFALED